VIDITLGLGESEVGVGSKIGFSFKVTDNFWLIEFNMVISLRQAMKATQIAAMFYSMVI
jgi:hypothetical protein